jgi:shikimate kinase
VGKSISQIFAKDGEIAFRQLEIELVKEIAQGKNQVIACGGGIVLNKINIDRLKSEAMIVYLTASGAVILERTSAVKNKRPLLKSSNKEETINKLLRFRKPFYERAADITIDTSKLDINAVADEIIARL